VDSALRKGSPDPLADGPTIQNAAFSSLGKKEYGIRYILRSLAPFTRSIPVVILSYYNPVRKTGMENFLKLAKSAGIWGVILPDLLFEEGKEWRKLCRKYGIRNIEMVAPNTSFERIRKIAAETTGFLYHVSVLGVTGARKDLDPGLIRRLRGIKRIGLTVPVYVGFGFSEPSQIKKVLPHCDGVIVGSAIVRRLNNRKTLNGYLKTTGDVIHGFRR